MKDFVFISILGVVGWVLVKTYPWKYVPKRLLDFIKTVSGASSSPNGDEIAAVFFGIGVSVIVAFTAATIAEYLKK